MATTERAHFIQCSRAVRVRPPVVRLDADVPKAFVLVQLIAITRGSPSSVAELGDPGMAVVICPSGQRCGHRRSSWFAKTTKDQAVAAGHSVGVERWQAMFEGLMERVAGRFARVAPRRRARSLAVGGSSRACDASGGSAGSMYGNANHDEPSLPVAAAVHLRSPGSGGGGGRRAGRGRRRQLDAVRTPVVRPVLLDKHGCGEPAPRAEGGTDLRVGAVQFQHAALGQLAPAPLQKVEDARPRLAPQQLGARQTPFKPWAPQPDARPASAQAPPRADSGGPGRRAPRTQHKHPTYTTRPTRPARNRRYI